MWSERCCSIPALSNSHGNCQTIGDQNDAAVIFLHRLLSNSRPCPDGLCTVEISRQKGRFKNDTWEVSAQDIPASAMMQFKAMSGYIQCGKLVTKKKEFRMTHERSSLRLFLYQQWCNSRPCPVEQQQLYELYQTSQACLLCIKSHTALLYTIVLGLKNATQKGA